MARSGESLASGLGHVAQGLGTTQMILQDVDAVRGQRVVGATNRTGHCVLELCVFLDAEQGVEDRGDPGGVLIKCGQGSGVAIQVWTDRLIVGKVAHRDRRERERPLSLCLERLAECDGEIVDGLEGWLGARGVNQDHTTCGEQRLIDGRTGGVDGKWLLCQRADGGCRRCRGRGGEGLDALQRNAGPLGFHAGSGGAHALTE